MMRLSQALYFGALLATAVAQLDLTRILSEIPACTQQCSVKVLGDAQCSVGELTTCLCPNDVLQKELATCVISSCSLEDQYKSTSILQDEICKGVPQPSRSREIRVATYILAALTYPVVILRFISRRVIANKFWWDDYAIMLATAILVPLTVLPILNSTQGFGKHFWNVPFQYVAPLRKTYYVTQLLYVMILISTKSSILLLYLRIFATPSFRRIVKIGIAIVVMHGLIFLFCVAFQCIPVNSIWTTHPARCINSRALVFSGAGVTILEDIVIMLLPIIELKKLNLSVKRRVAIGFMFALGSFACITSIIRLRFISLYGISIDLTWDNVDTVIWSEIEMFVSVICACLLCVRPLIMKFLPKFMQTTADITEISNSKRKSTTMANSPSWSLGVSSKLRSKQSGMEMLSGDDTLVNQEKESSSQVWVTQSASVDSKQIELQDMDSVDKDDFTRGFVGTTIVQAEPHAQEDANSKMGVAM